MNPSLIDSHCHLDSYQEANELENTLKLCQELSVAKLITVGTNAEDWEIYQEMAAIHPEYISYTVGLHPTSVGEDYLEKTEQIFSYFSSPKKPCALGEIGLDYFHLPKEESEKQTILHRQKKAFKEQLRIAYELDCPIVVHSRNAFHDCIEMINESKVRWQRVVFHCFSEGPEEVEILNRLGGRASFTGIITYKNAQNVREAALQQGIEKIMIETDAPYLSPVPYRGKRNQPAYTHYIAHFCAELFKMDLNKFSQISYRNTHQFYRL